MPPPKGTPNPLAGPGDYITDPVWNDTYPAIDPTKANLDGKSIVITGASKGIGRAMAISYAKAGASHIAIGARSDMTILENDIQKAAKSAQRQPPKVLKFFLDVTSRNTVDDAAALIGKEIGRVDILINNAGILGKAMIAESDPDAWWDIWTVNLRGPYLVARAFLPLMLKGGDKQIMNVSSVGAHVILPTVSAYQTSKLALLRFTEFIAVEYGEQGILPISIHPCNSATDITGGPEGVPDMLKHVVIETVELAADTVVFLTKERREWLAGRYINCTWDMPQFMAMEDDIVKGDKLKVRMIT